MGLSYGERGGGKGVSKVAIVTLQGIKSYFIGRFALIEMNETHPQNDVSKGNIVLQNVAAEAGIDKSTGNDIAHTFVYIVSSVRTYPHHQDGIQ